MWPFKRKIDNTARRFTVPVVPFVGNAWNETRQPSPGAMSFAYASGALIPQTPIGVGYYARTPMRIMTDQRFVDRISAWDSTGGIIAGQNIRQPLLTMKG
jgi:hypothetical protein